MKKSQPCNNKIGLTKTKYSSNVKDDSVMYKIVRMERFNDTVFRDEFKFEKRSDADDFFVQECDKEEVVDIHLYYCLPYGDDVELTCFTRHEKMKGIKNKY